MLDPPIQLHCGFHCAACCQVITGSEPAAFAFDQVSLSLEGKPILHGITVRSNARRIGLVGRNGSGKSTFARLFSGLIAPTQGSVTVAGVDVAKDRRAALSTVGILFQNPDHQIIFPTVEEELAFGLIQQGASKTDAADKVAQLLARFGKSHWAGEAVHSLSQGQKKLVCLMAVLAMEPKAVVLDEPLAGLDIPTQMQLARYLDDVGAMLVHIAHDPDHIRSYDQVLWLEEGRLMDQGSPANVLPAFTARMQELGGGDALSDLTG